MLGSKAILMIQCPNYSCQAINAEAHPFCQTCQAPVPRRILWAVGHRAEDVKRGAVIADRYLCKAPQIFLDFKAGTSTRYPGRYSVYGSTLFTSNALPSPSSSGLWMGRRHLRVRRYDTVDVSRKFGPVYTDIRGAD